ncbi:MAG: T9SS type A sorting domain-containing protein [Taibaiella sp.]|nr:T9SS type A sorting domain-containing protein [Taibaiella sp.]
MHLELQVSPWGGYSKRYATYGSIFDPPVYYNTYGIGVNNSNWVTGYYLDGSEHVPYVCRNITNVGDDPDFDILNHINPDGVPLKRTKITDLSDPDEDGKCAFTAEYASTGGVTKGAIGIYTEGSSSIVYDTIPFHSGVESMAMGINNNKDYVGYFEKDGIRYAYVVYGRRRAIPNYDIVKNYYPANFDNTEDNFKYEGDAAPGTDYYYKFDYINKDPVTESDFPFLHTITPYLHLTPSQIEAIENGQRYPSWYAYGLARNGTILSDDVTHITTVYGSKIPKGAELLKWHSKSKWTFQGYCFGMNLFALHAFDIGFGPSTLNAGGKAPEDMNNDIMASMARKKAIEAMGAAQFYTFKPGGYWNDVHYINFVLYGSSPVALKKQMFELIHKRNSKMIDSFYTDNSNFNTEPPNYYLMNFFNQAPLSEVWAHSLLPYAAERAISLTDSIDYIYCSDPNFPQDSVRVTIDYKAMSVTVHKKNAAVWEEIYEGLNLAYADINSFQWYDIQHSAALKPGKNSDRTKERTEHDGFDIYTWGICDYRISDGSNHDKYVERISGSEMVYEFEGITPLFHFNDANNAPFLLRSSERVIPLRSEFSNCSDVMNWHYSHPEGEMLMSRSSVSGSETDIVYNHGNIMKVENPDAKSKYYTVTTIANFTDDEEATVSVDSFILESGDTLRLEALDANNFKLSNGLDHHNKYDLNVRYISEESYFVKELSDIQIDSETDHIIVIQPNVEGYEVIILVDTDQDGSIDDTLSGQPVQPVEISDLKIDVYPNPFSDIVHIKFNSQIPENTVMQLYNIEGKLVYAHSLKSNAVEDKIPMYGIASGTYLIRIMSNRQELYKDKFIKN